MEENSAKPELLSDLSQREREIYLFVLESWPSSAIEIAEHFKEAIESREEKKKASTKYSYYLKKLVNKHVLFSKRIGNALIVWPARAEKLRTIHAILEAEDA